MKEGLEEFDELLEMEDEITGGGEVTPKEEEDLDIDEETKKAEVKESGSPIGKPGTADEG